MISWRKKPPKDPALEEARRALEEALRRNEEASAERDFLRDYLEGKKDD